MAYAMTKRGNLDNCVTYEFMCDTIQDMNDIEDRYRTIGSIAIVLEGYSGMEVYIAGSDKQWRALSAIGGGSGGSEGAESNLPIYAKTIEGATIEIENVDINSNGPQEKDIDFTLLRKGPAIVEIGEYTWEVAFEYIDFINQYTYFDEENGFGIALIDGSQESMDTPHDTIGNSINISGPAIVIMDQTHTYNEPQTVRIIYPAVTKLYSTQDSLYLGADEDGDNGVKVITDNNGSIAVGTNVTASGNISQAFGFGTTASGDGSHAEGWNTVASGYGSHTEGTYATASGDYSHAEGMQTVASGNYSHAEGAETVASGESSHAEGGNTEASGSYAHAEGYETQAIGETAHAEGCETVADSSYSEHSAHAEGYSTYAEDEGAHAEGCYTKAITYGAHAEGYSTYARNEGHAEGYETCADGAHAEGDNTLASGSWSHAEGSGTIAYGSSSHTEGLYTIAMGANQHVSGIYNYIDGVNIPEWQANTAYNVGDFIKYFHQYTYEIDDSNYTYNIFTLYKCRNAHTSGETFSTANWSVAWDAEQKLTYAEIIGNGTANNARSNARALDWNGNEYLKGDLYVGCSANSTGGTKVIPLPTPPTTDGTYTLQCTVSNGTATYSWV